MIFLGNAWISEGTSGDKVMRNTGRRERDEGKKRITRLARRVMWKLSRVESQVLINVMESIA